MWPEGYSFLPELAASPVRQVSIETAQSNLNCSVLEKLPGKTIILGVLDLVLSSRSLQTPALARPADLSLARKAPMARRMPMFTRPICRKESARPV